MLAKDIMQRSVVTATPNMSLRELGRLLHEKGITGVPVVDGEGHVLGVVSQTDLVRRKSKAAESSGSFWDPDLAAQLVGLPTSATDYTKVEQVMSRKVFWVAEEAPAREVADLMLRERIQRVVVLSGERLSGIITTLDVVRAAAKLL